MPILSLLALAAIQAAPAPPAPPAPAPESRCAYIIRDAAGTHAGEDPNLHVLDQTAADGQFAPTKPAGAVGIQCWRGSIIPGPHDEEVILAHLALIISETAGAAPHRLGALDFDGTHFRFTMRTGTLTPAEQAAVDARLAEFLARVHPSSAPAH
jgi:hypothetical protein